MGCPFHRSSKLALSGLSVSADQRSIGTKGAATPPCGHASKRAPNERMVRVRKTFVVLSAAGAHRDLTKQTREQPYWDEHARFIDGITEGFILMGGPFEDEGGAMLIVRAQSEAEVRKKLGGDPWYTHGVIQLQSIHRWDIFIDERASSERATPGGAQA